MKKLLCILLFAMFSFGYSQSEKDTIKLINLNSVVISSQRFVKQKRTISQHIESISKKEIELQNSQNTADVFANFGTLSVQKSQQGGGSPVIRGFEASRILLLVDGVQMNNLIYRSGHLQNAVTIDKNMLENIDVLFGPTSTIYGSDALGGAIYLQTKNPKLIDANNNKTYSGNFLSNYSTINRGKSSHFEINYAQKKWASLSLFSFNDYEDLKMGKQKNGSNAFFGERDFYVETINGVDTKVKNDNKYLQKFSGYSQYDLMQKIIYHQDNNTKHNLNIQYSTSSDIPRYDRLTDLNGNNLRNAIWYYGPQKRFLSAYKLSKEKLVFNSDLNFTISYQKIEESRINRNFGSKNLNNRTENVSVFGLNSDFKAKIGTADIIYGFDFTYDDLKSSAFVTNTETKVKSTLDSRYPDGKNNTFSGEGFVYFNNNIDKTTTYNASIRLGYKSLYSSIIYNPLNLPFTTINQKNFTYSGAFGFVKNPSKNLKIAFNLASAFRVPNIDDLSKIFESTNGKLFVPNSNLKPEKTITADFGLTIWQGSKFQVENNFFITKLFDPIITDSFTFNGQSSIFYNGVNSVIQANQNQGKGIIAGSSSTIKALLFKKLFIYGTINFTKGQITNNSGKFPLDHIAPVFGKAGFRFNHDLFTLDLNINFNGNKNLKDYSPSGEDNLVYATANGTPAWETYNVKSAIFISSKFTVFCGIENILDIQYRTFASGINAAGRNYYFGAKFNF